MQHKNRMSTSPIKWKNLRSVAGIAIVYLVAAVVVSAEQRREPVISENNGTTKVYASHYLWHNGVMIYRHVWPEMKFSWQIVVGTVIGFFAAALGSVGGVGGGGIFVSMLTLIIGFDPKSSTAISKCMITGAAGATVYYNLRLRHPTLDLPIIDYDLALLFQPMLVLGISIGVAFNVIFADWMLTILLIILFIATSTKAFLKGVETWKKETIMKQVVSSQLITTRII